MMEKFRPTRAKRMVVLKFNNAEPEAFRTCPELYLKYGKDKVGIGLNALWNALSKDGVYQNKRCTISYQKIDSLKTQTWE